MKKRGFTLIELLAVIVILSIIALIATPMVLNTIDEAKQGAAKASATSYIEAIENKVATSLIKNEKYEDKEDYVYDEIEVDIKGTKPTGGIYSLKNGVVTSGVFCIDGYEINYADKVTEVQGKCTGEELKLSGSVKLSESSGYYTYPESRTFEVIENISGGILSCTSSDEEVAICSISETTVTVTSGTKEGTAILTIKSEGSSKYKEAQAAYLVTTKEGLLSYTANGYSGVYDTEAHGIVVSSENAIIKYGTEEGSYTLDASPMYSDVGEYIIYFEITKAGYTTITGNKTIVITKADGKIELEKTSGSVEYDKTISIEIKENASAGEVSIVVANPDIVEATLVDGKLNVKAKQTGVTTITLTTAETNNYTSASTGYTVTVTKANNTLTLSANTGSYTYPEGGTFEITENKSGGTLSCTSNNEAVATCSVSGSTVTVTLGTTEGVATLTIKSAETDNYNASQVAYVVTTSPGLLSYTATGYSGTYDGAEHGITVQASGATIKYGTTEGTYNLTSSPTYTDVGTYTVYYEVTKAGYTTVTGSKDIVITKASGSITAPTAKTLTYTGSAQELVNAGSSSTGTIQYKLGSSGTYSTSLPTATDAGTYTVYYKVVGDLNHSDVAEASINVTINKAILNYTTSGYSGTYDGSEHSITVISSGSTIKYGTTDGTYDLTSSPTYTDVGEYTVYYQITREGYVSVTGSEKIVITKVNNTLTLSENTGSYTYPEGGTFEITENTSGGALSCTSNNEAVATCSISGSTVTVTLGTTEGVATLTITSAATTNYNASQVAYVVTTSPGLLSVTANDYSGTYDGTAHGITVQASGSTIKYGTTDGTYDLTSSPTYTDVGTYMVYYQVTKVGYKTVTGSKTVVISKANGGVTLSATSGTVTYPTAGSFTVTGNTSGGTLSCTSSNEAVATCSVSGTTVTVTPGITAGSATLTVTSATTTNYNAASAAYSVTTASGTLSVTATGYTRAFDGREHGITVTCSGATIKYGTISGSGSGSVLSYTLTSSPTYMNAGTYTVYYQVTKEGYKTVTGSKQVVISKLPGTVVLSSTSGTVTYPTAGTFEVTGNTSGGTLSCTSSNSAIATCSELGTTFMVIPGTTEGTATLTITSAATTNYNAASATYTATVKMPKYPDDVSVGDYVSMTPTSTSYTISKSLTGYTSDQTINPSELNLWRVIQINEDGTIDMVSDNISSTLVYFQGQTGYKNLVGALNTIAKQYENSNYTVGSRHMGYNGQTEYLTDTANTVDSTSTTAPWTVSTSDNSNEAQGGGDTLYTTDTDLVKNALGSLVAYNPSVTSSAYWLASRHYICNGLSWAYSGRYVVRNSISNSYLYYYGSGFNTSSISYAVRPIVTLKSGLQATGAGILEDPWVLE